MSVEVTITNSDLLQANATIIAGLLIFATVSPLSKTLEVVSRNIILGATYLTVLLLAFSIVSLLLDNNQLARIFFGIGLFGVPVTIIVVASTDRLLELFGRIQRRQKQPDSKGK